MECLVNLKAWCWRNGPIICGRAYTECIVINKFYGKCIAFIAAQCTRHALFWLLLFKSAKWMPSNLWCVAWKVLFDGCFFYLCIRKKNIYFWLLWLFCCGAFQSQQKKEKKKQQILKQQTFLYVASVFDAIHFDSISFYSLWRSQSEATNTECNTFNVVWCHLIASIEI